MSTHQEQNFNYMEGKYKTFGKWMNLFIVRKSS